MSINRQALASVVIPTLHSPHNLPTLVDVFSDHPRVGEVIVIANGPAPHINKSPKVRVLQQSKNIYVNPAWNLGAREARHDYLVIANDDILVDPDLITYGVRALDMNIYPILGMHGSSLGRAHQAHPKIRPAPFVNAGFGTLMFLRRSNFVEIPAGLLIYGGDDWLFFNQSRPGATIIGFPLRTQLGTTSKRPEFQQILAADQERFAAMEPAVLGSRRWHRALPALSRIYDLRASIAASLMRFVRGR